MPVIRVRVIDVAPVLVNAALVLARNMREGAATAPNNFDADAQEDEGRQPHHHICPVLAQAPDGPAGKPVAHVNGGGDCDQSGDGRARE